MQFSIQETTPIDFKKKWLFDRFSQRGRGKIFGHYSPLYPYLGR